jgi:deoxyribose-phosphate aldolase
VKKSLRILYKEINLYDSTLSETEIVERAFKAIKQGITTIFVAPYYLGKLNAILPKSIKLACPVDYPHGLGDTYMRQHGCISAINRGASFVDLVVNPVYFINREKQKLVDDLQAHKKICEEKKVELRILLDYRMYVDGLIYTTANLLANIGIKYVIPSTGQFVEDYSDNLIICQLLMNKNPSIQTIFNGVFCSPEQLEKLEMAKIYGVRLKSYNLVYL